MNKNIRNEILRTVVLIVIYVLLGNARSIQSNPVIPGAVIAANMIVPVIAGILFGKRTGALVGFFGTLLNALSPAGTVFEFAAIIPHAVMGWSAGFIKEKMPRFIAAFALIIGHVLNIDFFILFKLINFSQIANWIFWRSLVYESFAEIVSIVLIVSIYRLGFEEKT